MGYDGLEIATVVNSEYRFGTLCGGHLKGQSELYHIS